jgi:CheY-like chemotaxis protein
MSAETPLTALKVLLVDDHAGTRELTHRMLARLRPAKIVEAESGDQALRFFGDTPAEFDLVVCDWNMPGMSGIELFGKVRAIRPKVPFLMVTGRVDPESVILAKRSGVSGYIAKPFSPDELKRKIEIILAQGHDRPPAAA